MGQLMSSSRIVGGKPLPPSAIWSDTPLRCRVWILLETEQADGGRGDVELYVRRVLGSRSPSRCLVAIGEHSHEFVMAVSLQVVTVVSNAPSFSLKRYYFYD